jgi:aminopeptidase-like protein
MEILGNTMYGWAKDLFPICRSLTGKGVTDTLAYLEKLLPNLSINQLPSGTKAFDWELPQEWEINDAFVADESGNRIIDFKENNLHVVGYSEPVDAVMGFDELSKHLYSLPKQPDAIPYVTSYYKKRWGFCLSEKQMLAMQMEPDKKYHVKIDSRLFDGHLTYGECFIPGESDKEVLLSTYICHPSMANNEVSGSVVAAAIAQYIKSAPRRLSYRILFLPETIGPIAYLSKNLKHMKSHVMAGYVLTCLGDDKAYSYLASRYGNSLADKIAKRALRELAPDYKSYYYLERGSDERQFCAPGVDLPICSIMRSKYGEYPEYHTSLDDMSFISPKGLEGGYNIIKKCIDILESDVLYKNTVLCEPQMGKRGLYPSISTKDSGMSVRNMMNVLAYADGTNYAQDISEIIGIPKEEVNEILEKLEEAGVVERA